MARTISNWHLPPIRPPREPILIRVEFLLVCWYGLDLDRSSRFGWKTRRLPKVGFVPNSPDVVSPEIRFLDPAQVIWGVHLILCFSESLTGDFLEPFHCTAT